MKPPDDEKKAPAGVHYLGEGVKDIAPPDNNAQSAGNTFAGTCTHRGRDQSWKH